MNILTFDVEDWFHILDNESTRSEKEWLTFESRIHGNVGRILELLDRQDQKATFFCLGWIAKQYPGVIRGIADQGHEIGCHSFHHQLVFELTPAAFKKDTEMAIKTLEDLTGKKIISYRAPGFSITPESRWALEILAAHGIERDSSIFPAYRAHGGYPTFPSHEPVRIRINNQTLKEFPINPGTFLGKQIVYSGGGYFRLLPYFIIDSLSKRDKYIMTYFHPRDFDAGQPRIQELSRTRAFKSYVGLGSSFSKLKRWIENYTFVDIETADREIEWDHVKSIAL